MTEYLRQDEHERFKELSALSNSGTLSAGETAELSSHLQLCAACREIHEQYRLLAREGIPVLAAAFSEEEDSLAWDSSATRKKLLARVRAAEQESRIADDRPSRTLASRFWNPAVLSSPRIVGTVAACLLLAVGVVGYQLGGYFETAVQKSIPSDAARAASLELEKKSIETQLRMEEGNRAQIEQDRLQKKEELVKVRARLRELENHLDALEAAKKEAAEHLQALSQKHDLASAKRRGSGGALHAQPGHGDRRSSRAATRQDPAGQNRVHHLRVPAATALLPVFPRLLRPRGPHAHRRGAGGDRPDPRV